MPLEDNITNLIHTFQESNYALALELIAGEKTLQARANEIFIVYYFSKNQLTTARAKELLSALEEESLNDFIEQHESLIIRESNAHYTISEKIALLQKLFLLDSFPFLSINKIAVAIALYQQQVIGLALDCTTEKQQYDIINHCLNGQSIFYLDKLHALNYFPSELTKFKQLTHVTFFIYEQQQKEGNNPFLLPDTIKDLQQLRALHLYGGTVENFPSQALQQLSQLKSISLTTNQKVNMEELQLALPNCHFDITTV